MTRSLDFDSALNASSKPVMACFPLYPPLELFHAMGFHPVVLWGLREAVPSVQETDKHVQTFACSVARYLTEFLVSKMANKIDHVFFYNACDTLRNLPEIIEKGMKKSGVIPHIFHYHVPMHDLHVSRTTGYFKAEVSRLISDLEKNTRVDFSPARFQESVSLYNKMRNLYKQIQDHVANGSASFSRFAELVQYGNFMPVEDTIKELEAFIHDLPERRSLENEKNMVCSGILPPSLALMRAIEEAGLVIAANDIATMNRSFYHVPTFTGDVGDYFVDFYTRHCPCPTLLFTADRRVDYLIAVAKKSRARGLIFLGEKFCEYEYLEAPFITSTFKKLGIHVLDLEIAMDDRDSIASFKTRIDAFSELLSNS